MVTEMTPLEEAVWAHVYSLEFHARHNKADTGTLEDARAAMFAADCAITGLRQLRQGARDEG
jgi:hypothetical protein